MFCRFKEAIVEFIEEFFDRVTVEDGSGKPADMGPEPNDAEGKKRDNEFDWRWLVDFSGNTIPGGGGRDNSLFEFVAFVPTSDGTELSS